MIALDNGPANGDYARYIERLIAETKTASLLPAALSAPVFGSPTFAALTRVAPSTVARPAPAAQRNANIVASANPRAFAPEPLKTAPRAAPVDPVLIRAVGTIALGLVLAAIGFLSTPTKFILLSIGFIVFASGVRALMRAAAVARSAAKVA